MSFINIDILLLIADHIDDHRDYFRMLRVCRGWHEVLSPGAYSRISIKNQQIYHFVRHIYKNPRLGAQIRNLHIEWDDVDTKVRDKRLIRDVIRTWYDLNSSAWEPRLREGDPDAWLVVLLPFLESVTSLSLDFAPSNFFLFTIGDAALGEEPFNTKPVLQQLKSVTYQSEESDEGDTYQLMAFFWLPAMRVLKVNQMIELIEEDDEVRLDWPGCCNLLEPGTSGITEMRFGGPVSRCNATKGLADYITCCANLEIFEYQHGRVGHIVRGRGFSPGFRPHAFYKALVTQKHSLCELRLNDRGQIDTRDEEGPPLNPSLVLDNPFRRDDMHPLKFGSLAEFSNLRELRIPLSTILQFHPSGKSTVSLIDVLPPSLEYLHLSHCLEQDFSMLMEELCSVIQHRKMFPNLRRLCVRPSHPEEAENPSFPNLRAIEPEGIPPEDLHWFPDAQVFKVTPYGHRVEVCKSALQFFEGFTKECHDAGIHFWISKGESVAGDEPFTA